LDRKQLQDRGIAIRNEVLGPAYHTKSLADFDDFTRPFQEFAAAYCWGELWGRDDLPRKTRSLINVALLAGLNRLPELRLHVLGALRNGCTEKEIQGALLQCIVYCGVAAGGEGFRVAREAIAEFRRQPA